MNKKKREHISGEERLSPRGTQLGWRKTSPFYKGGGRGVSQAYTVKGSSGTFRDSSNLEDLVPLIVNRDLLDQVMEEKEREATRYLQVWKAKEVLSIAQRILYNRQFQCFYLHFYQGMGIVDISKSLKIHQPQVTKAIAVSIEKLQKFFKIKRSKRYRYGKIE